MKNKPMYLTLCASCAKQYYDMPDRYIKREDRTQRIKERCDFCHVRMGYGYIITEKVKRGGGK